MINLRKYLPLGNKPTINTGLAYILPGSPFLVWLRESMYRKKEQSDPGKKKNWVEIYVWGNYHKTSVNYDYNFNGKKLH